MIDYAELQTLERICAHHNVAAPELIADLARLIEWAHQTEAARFGQEPPVFLLCLEQMLLHRYPRRGQQPEPKEVAA